MAKQTSVTKWLEHIKLLPQHQVFPGMRGRILHSETMTFVFWEIDCGADLPAHSHPHEQVSHIIEGTFVLSIDGEARLLEAGAMSIIPSDASHSGKAITDCQVLDIFSPKREDYVFG
jgi:quercetin dioxygenase-like cupin family protein